MAHSTSVKNVQQPVRVSGRLLCVILLSLVAVLLGACASGTSNTYTRLQLPPLQYDGRSITVEEVAALAPAPDLLGLDDEMRDFVETYTGGLYNDRQRMNHLHQSLTSAAIMRMVYGANAEGNAVEVFHRGSANCLSYANLFIALAREAGLDASYQWVKVRPQWSRVGERVAVRLHVNVLVKLRHGEQYIVDIDPLPPSQTTGNRVLKDVDALALHHNNLAMAALNHNEIDRAWAHGVRALQLSPQLSLLWVNMGVIYRVAGQHQEAESSYLKALELNSRDRSAMNNLVVLYRLDGNAEQTTYWEDKVARYRTDNPWYHAWLGDKAGESGDWSQALMHYSDALRRSQEDSRLQYAVGLIHYKLGDYAEAEHYVSLAIETAVSNGELRSSELAGYQMQLDAIIKEQLAGLD